MNSPSVYVHIPFCKARCGYCAFSSCTDMSLTEDYFAKLFAETDYYADRSVPVYTVYIGGGTPSSVPTEYLDALFDRLRRNFDLSRVREITVECNPESADDKLFECLVRNGVNRLSFGLQSVNDATLRRIGRLHTYRRFCEALQRARSFGFCNVNADIIIGLPETHADFIRSVREAAALPLTHLSMYALELHPGTPLFEQSGGVDFFDGDEQADMYDEAVAVLARQGFERYEISNFCKEGNECKHNLNYWREGRYFAFGASASGFVGNARYVNPRSVKEYMTTSVSQMHSFERQVIDPNEEANEFVMLGLRLEQGISGSEFAARYGEDFWRFFLTADKLRADGFLIADGDRIKVPSDKFYVINSILAELWKSQ